MRDRGTYWPAVPDWRAVTLGNPVLDIRAATGIRTIWLASGDLDAFGRSHGDAPILGPREISPPSRYRLRVAPDRLLLVSDAEENASFGWSTDGFAITDFTDGMIVLDVSGPGSDELMSDGCGYDFAGASSNPLESALMMFAGIRLAVSRRESGWRLHAERPMATALWRWLSLSCGREGS